MVEYPPSYPMSERVNSTVREEFPMPPLSDEILKQIIDRSRIPEVMAHTLRGDMWIHDVDKDGNVTGHWEQRGVALMNETGIRHFSSFLFSTMSPDKLLTRLTEEEVNDRAREMAKTLILLIAERGDEFGIIAANRTSIVRMLDDFYFMNLTASRHGNILDIMKNVYERRETYTPEKRNESFLGR